MNLNVENDSSVLMERAFLFPDCIRTDSWRTLGIKDTHAVCHRKRFRDSTIRSRSKTRHVTSKLHDQHSQTPWMLINVFLAEINDRAGTAWLVRTICKQIRSDSASSYAVKGHSISLPRIYTDLVEESFHIQPDNGSTPNFANESRFVSSYLSSNHKQCFCFKLNFRWIVLSSSSPFQTLARYQITPKLRVNIVGSPVTASILYWTFPSSNLSSRITAPIYINYIVCVSLTRIHSIAPIEISHFYWDSNLATHHPPLSNLLAYTQ